MNIDRRKRVFKKIYTLIDGMVLFMDHEGYILESSDPSMIGETLEIPGLVKGQDIHFHKGWSYRKVTGQNGKQYILALDNKQKSTLMAMALISMIIEDEMDELTSEEIILEFLKGRMSKEVAMELLGKVIDHYDQKIIVGILEYKNGFEEEIEFILKNVIPETQIIGYDNNHFVLIFKSLENDDVLESMISAITEELLIEPRLSIGTEVEGFVKIKDSFEDAMTALTVSKTYRQKQRIAFYKDLALPIMIDKMDLSDLHRLSKAISGNIHSVMEDDELLLTAKRFFRHSLNVTDTSQVLFIHRNTLIYRLNKIQKITGYDLRNFEDALNFYIGLHMHNRLL